MLAVKRAQIDKAQTTAPTNYSHYYALLHVMENVSSFDFYFLIVFAIMQKMEDGSFCMILIPEIFLWCTGVWMSTHRENITPFCIKCPKPSVFLLFIYFEEVVQCFAFQCISCICRTILYSHSLYIYNLFIRGRILKMPKKKKLYKHRKAHRHLECRVLLQGQWGKTVIVIRLIHTSANNRIKPTTLTLNQWKSKSNFKPHLGLIVSR